MEDLCRRSWWESGGDSEVLVGEQSYVGTGRDSWWSSLEGSGILVELLVKFLGESGILVELLGGVCTERNTVSVH